MKNIIKNSALAAILALTSLSTAHASLTEAASNALLGVDLDEAVAISTAFPGADLDTVITAHSDSILIAPTGNITNDFATLRGTLGPGAVQTASRVLPLLNKMNNNITSSIVGFMIASSFLGEEHQDSIDNYTMMIKRLGEIQETLNQIEQAVRQEIKQ